MVNVPDSGHRPVFSPDLDEETEQACFSVCPAAGSIADEAPDPLGGRQEGVGPVLEVWEGHAGDEAIHFSGSSGGALTALSLYGIEKGEMGGVLHVGMDSKSPLLNRTRMSRSREDLMKNVGSRYAPASVCDRLAEVEKSEAPCVVVGQPSEITALRKAQKQNSALDKNVGVALSFFCAGSPATEGTAELLRKKGINPEDVDGLRYRGHGWPGLFSVWKKGDETPALEMTYADSWAFIQSYRSWGVHLWPDGSGESADISCGDPWYRKVKKGEPGSSLIVVRTERGKKFLEGAVAAGYLKVKPSSLERVVLSQQNLLKKKGAAWGRLTTMKCFGIPTPDHVGQGLWKMWWRLSFKDKIGSTFGTARRLYRKGYLKPDHEVVQEPKERPAEFSPA